MPTMGVVKINGQNLKRIRQEQLLSREKLAEKAGTHRDHIGRLERGDIATPHMQTIKDLAEALAVSPSAFVEFD